MNPGLQLVPPDNDAPDLDAIRRGQIREALARLTEDHTELPTLGFPDLVDVTGPLLPGHLWVILARPENGKTTFCMNVARRWHLEGRGFVYFGTEEEPAAAQLRFAAISVGLDPGAVVAGEWDRIGGERAQEEIRAELSTLMAVSRCYFAEDTRPSIHTVRAAIRAAVERGIPIVVLDHFHRMAVPETPNHTATLAETVRRIKQMAVDAGVTVLMAAQAKRGEGPLAKYYPPLTESGMGTSALEQEADVMLGLFRPLKRGLDKAVEQQFVKGEADQSEVLQPHTMGVKVLKHRRNADLSGKIVHLHCEKSMLANLSYRTGP